VRRRIRGRLQPLRRVGGRVQPLLGRRWRQLLVFRICQRSVWLLRRALGWRQQRVCIRLCQLWGRGLGPPPNGVDGRPAGLTRLLLQRFGSNCSCVARRPTIKLTVPSVWCVSALALSVLAVVSEHQLHSSTNRSAAQRPCALFSVFVSYFLPDQISVRKHRNLERCAHDTIWCVTDWNSVCCCWCAPPHTCLFLSSAFSFALSPSLVVFTHIDNRHSQELTPLLRRPTTG